MLSSCFRGARRASLQSTTTGPEYARVRGGVGSIAMYGDGFLASGGMRFPGAPSVAWRQLPTAQSLWGAAFGGIGVCDEPPQSLGDSSPRPKKWAYDDGRRRVAGVAEDVEFRTKPELAAEMVHQAVREGLAIRWVTADAVYGGNFAFRQGSSIYAIGDAGTSPIDGTAP